MNDQSRRTGWSDRFADKVMRWGGTRPHHFSSRLRDGRPARLTRYKVRVTKPRKLQR